MPTLDQLRAITQSWSAQFLEWIQGFPLPLLRGELFLLLLILIIIFGYQKFKSEKNQLFKTFWERCIGLFEMLFEKIYGFFTDIIWEKQKYWVKSFVIWVFFVILFANLIGVLFDFLGTMFPWLENYITAPTSDTDFNIAMAIVVVWLVLYLQVQKLWFWHFLYEYFPVLGKGLIKIERWEMSARAYYPLRAVMKLFDIVVGIFTGLLDIIWYLAKVVSLSFRLTGNITSGTILLGMLIAGLKALSIWLSGWELPLVLPLIVIAQGLLSAVIQAFVFALLTAIFIKVATEEW